MIVVARGGGSVEDLLPFSDEALIRAVAALRTPVVSAIGHEPDSPLLDLVADVRCSTPTDAGKRVVPDVAEELSRVDTLRQRGRRVLGTRVDRGLAELADAAPVRAAVRDARAGRLAVHSGRPADQGQAVGAGAAGRGRGGPGPLPGAGGGAVAGGDAAARVRGGAEGGRRHGRAGPGRRAGRDRAAGPGRRRLARRGRRPTESNG